MPDTPTDVSSLIALLSPPTLVASGQLSKTALCVLGGVCVCVCVCVCWGVCMLTMPPQRTAPVCGWRITEGQMTSEYGPGTLPSSACTVLTVLGFFWGGAQRKPFFLPGQGRLVLRAGPLPP